MLEPIFLTEEEEELIGEISVSETKGIVSEDDIVKLIPAIIRSYREKHGIEEITQEHAESFAYFLRKVYKTYHDLMFDLNLFEQLKEGQLNISFDEEDDTMWSLSDAMRRAMDEEKRK